MPGVSGCQEEAPRTRRLPGGCGESPLALREERSVGMRLLWGTTRLGAPQRIGRLLRVTVGGSGVDDDVVGVVAVGRGVVSAAGDEAETGVVEVAVHLDRGEPVLGVEGDAIDGDSRCAVPDDVSRDHRGAEGPGRRVRGVPAGSVRIAGVSIALSLPSARSSSLEATLTAGIEMLGGREADSTVVPGSPPGQPDALPSGEAVCPIVARDVPACPSQWEGRGAGGRFPGPASVRRHSQEDLGVGSAAIRRDAGCLRWASGSRTVSSRGGVQKSPAVACARMALGAERMTSQGIPTHLRDADFWSIWCSRSRITLGPPRRSESWLCRGRRLRGGVCVRVGPGRGRIRGCST